MVNRMETKWRTKWRPSGEPNGEPNDVMNSDKCYSSMENTRSCKFVDKNFFFTDLLSILHVEKNHVLDTDLSSFVWFLTCLS